MPASKRLRQLPRVPVSLIDEADARFSVTALRPQHLPENDATVPHKGDE
jgi:hypothetical protein